jgi:cyclopropane fatty-acyl-phospholipid synthase-like methyltransferase
MDLKRKRTWVGFWYMTDRFTNRFTSEYLVGYKGYMNSQIRKNPNKAVGGLWRELGDLQFDFLVQKGLKPEHKFLDIGCGVLRGGLNFIKYLEVGNYYGMDISSEAIIHSKNLVVEMGFQFRLPKLIVNRDLKFRELFGKKFDYILAQSVFTHLPSEYIEECFENIRNVMHGDSLFYFTFFHATEYKQVGTYKFRYPFKHFKFLAKKYGHKVKDVSSEYMHPRGQWLVEMTL